MVGTSSQRSKGGYFAFIVDRLQLYGASRFKNREIENRFWQSGGFVKLKRTLTPILIRRSSDIRSRRCFELVNLMNPAGDIGVTG